MTAALELRGVIKRYGARAALDGVDLCVPEGSIFGFLGPNGAGKTTALRLITGLARPTAGSIRVLGHDALRPDGAVRARIGFLPDVPGFYDWMTAEEFLSFAGGLFGLTGKTLRDRVRALLDMAGLGGVKTRVGGYSRGMKQRLGVAQALINAPLLLMLDEPTSALDPMGRKDVLDMLASLKGRTTVFFSTHILADVERICDTVAILDRGRVAAQAPIQELTSRYGQSKISVEVEEGADGLAAAFAGEPWVSAVGRADDGAILLTVRDAAAARRAVPAMVAARGLALERMEPAEMGLEEVFVTLVGGEGS